MQPKPRVNLVALGCVATDNLSQNLILADMLGQNPGMGIGALGHQVAALRELGWEVRLLQMPTVASTHRQLPH